MAELPNLSIKEADNIVQKIYESYENKARKGQSERIGASELGKECNRAIWYSFRWASNKVFSGRMLRLFQSGHLQEPRVIEDLRSIGCSVKDVDPETGKQFKITDGCLVMKPDGLVTGVPGAEQTIHALEIKTHSEKSFKEVNNKGVKIAKPEHYIQAQLEMLFMGLKRALYVAINKNTDEMYVERLDFDKAFAEVVRDKGKRIAKANTPPEKLRDDPGFFTCKFCDHHAICHMDKVPQANCRTCCHSEAFDDGMWHCWYWDAGLDYKQQQEGCEKHLFIPDLIPNAKVVDSSEAENWIEYETDGVKWKQGEGYITSKEMVEDAT